MGKLIKNSRKKRWAKNNRSRELERTGSLTRRC